MFESALKRRFGVEGFERPHSRPWRIDGPARRVRRGVRFRRAGGRPQLAGFVHRRRIVSMVSVACRRSRLRRCVRARTVSRPKRLSILGATGSIGRSCAQVIAAAPGRFSVVSVAGGRDGAALAKCAIELGAEFAALADPAGYRGLEGRPSRLCGRNRRRPGGGRGSRSARRRSGGFGNCRRGGIATDLRRGRCRAHGRSR